MATRASPPPASPVGHAADRLLEACAGAACIRFDPEVPVDALAAGVAAIGRIYERAAVAPRRKPRRKK
ncbi:hypothetical protein [Sphingomonas koreensis]|uniref:hypothetical protein n=1 Tax=Sphingomonas koreensis TaxID=93064 RepID=UPI000F7E34A3|nr:hypothetical protein [Sphingomonas koreensis]MDC7808782.1 hypothetical protein [Sphingomonas koreensis]RSU98923.1 hypothetical protein CA256_03060 [Sphingomonas koreensis]